MAEGGVLERAAAGSALGRLVGVRGSAAAQRLLSIDDFWTTQLEVIDEQGEATDEDLAALRDAAFHLTQGLAEIKPLAGEIGAMLSGDLDEATVDETLDRLAQLSGQSDLGARWREALPDYSFRGAAISACTLIAERADIEASDVQIKLAQLETGELLQGDFPLPMRCSLVLLIAAGALVGIVAGAGAVAAGGAAGTALALTYVSAGGWTVSSVVGAGVAWSKASCPNVLGKIGGHR